MAAPATDKRRVAEDEVHDAMFGSYEAQVEILTGERDRFGDALRDLILAIHEYTLWEPGRAGHAQAHRDLVKARNVAEGVLRDA